MAATTARMRSSKGRFVKAQTAEIMALLEPVGITVGPTNNPAAKVEADALAELQANSRKYGMSFTSQTCPACETEIFWAVTRNYKSAIVCHCPQ